MKITGTANLHAPPPQAWTALNDPAVLARTFPGCDHLEVTGPGTIRLTATAAVASTRGTYTGEVEVSDRQEPASCRLTVTAAGAPGTLSANVLVRLAPTANGSTEVTYDADAAPHGMIAGVGQRLLASTAKKMAGEFFASVDDVLMSRAAAVPGSAGVEEAPSAAPPPGVRAGGAAGVASPTDAATRGGSGMTPEPPTADRQPTGRTGARPPTVSFMGARPPTRAFLQGALAGTAATLAGVSVARLLRKRSR